MIYLTILSTIASGILASIATVYFQQRQVKKYNKRLRNVAIKAIKIFRKYADKDYDYAKNDFNTSLSITEKRIVLVLLHKLGIPVASGIESSFDINNVEFMKSARIKEKDLDNIEFQILCGNCDKLFFIDPDDYFTKNTTKIYKRNLATKFVVELFSKSKINIKENRIDYSEPLSKYYSAGEINTLLVFIHKIQNYDYFDINSTNYYPLNEKIEKLVNEIKIGLWDNYLEWSFEAYNNVIVQSQLASNITKNINMASQTNNLNTF